jgi:hypothetical protein
VKRALQIAAACAGVLVLLVVLPRAVWAFEALAYLLFGWVAYVIGVAPRVRIHPAGVVTFAVLLPAMLIAAHAFARWLWTGTGHASPWRWKWTTLGVATLLLMFVTGIAATGIVHQTGWLITSPQPLLKSSFASHRVNRTKCESSLRQLGLAYRSYLDAHPGFRPQTIADLADAVYAYDGSPDIFICPASDQDRVPGTQPADWRRAMHDDPAGTISYAVAPPGTLGPDGLRPVLLHDKSLDIHTDGLVVLYEAGDAEWLDEADAKAWLAKAYGK